MGKNIAILCAAVLVTALPFLLRPDRAATGGQPDQLSLIIITPHNEAIRYEFGLAFSRWHEERYGQPVNIDWRAIGGTTEITRYLTAEFVAAARGWWTGLGHPWPAGAGDVLVDRRFDTLNAPTNPAERARWEPLRDLYTTFRQTDDAARFSAHVDLFFGGGEYDHQKAFQEGLTVAPWPADQPPAGLFTAPDGTELIPSRIGGETWRTPTFFGTAISTFGICYNLDRLRDLGIAQPPSHWDDLADPRFFRQLGVADPTKSGSIAKAFELIIHEKCQQAVSDAGFQHQDIDRFEAAIAAARLPPGRLPPDVPEAYQAAIELGWEKGVGLVQRIGANARYFTDSASKIPIDVGAGNAAAGLAIDFYARFQAQSSRAPDGREVMQFITPRGGSGASCDPISLLRGAPHRETAVRFLEFVLGDEGQRLWTYRPGTPGGPRKFALRRIPIRRTFYASEIPWVQDQHLLHRARAADDLTDPQIDPYQLARDFIYRPRWTGQHFGIHRDLVRAMCLNSARELVRAWGTLLRHGGPDRQAAALQLMGRRPSSPLPLDWRSALRMGREYDRLDYLREWTIFYREQYAGVERMVAEGEARR
jgi:iron(III) transport system substrate-binding protein